MRFYIKILLSLFLIASVVSAQPTISIVNNSKTLNDATTKIFLNNSESITFRANTTDPTNAWNWYKDSVLQVNNYNNFTTSFTTGTYHYITVNTTNSSGKSNNLTWGINVYPAISSTQITLMNESPAQNFEAAISANDFPALINTPTEIYTNLIGLGFYAFLWTIVFAMIWIKQASINIPAIIGVIFGGILVTFLPPQYQLISQVLIVFGIFAVLFVFFKGRG